MFGTAEGRDRFDESVLDSNLRLAYNQGDIGTEEFLQSGIFDTTGSFSLAYDIYKGASSEEESMKLLAQLFNGESGKAYAGTITDADMQADIISQKEALVNEYFKDDITNADAFMGGDFFDAGKHINQRILSNKMEQIGDEMAAIAQAHLAHQSLASGVVGYDTGTGTFEKTELEGLKKKWLDSALELSKIANENGIKFNYEYANMSKNPIMNEAGTAASPVHGGSVIFTGYGCEIITPSMVEATGRPVYSDREHLGYDVSKSWAEIQEYGTDEYFTAPETGNFDFEWNSVDGAGIAIYLTSIDERYQHLLGHNFTDSIDAMTELLILNGSTEVAAGTVIGKYQDYDTNKSTGSHSHWEVYRNMSEGIFKNYERIDNDDWITDRYGCNPFMTTEGAEKLSGLPESGSYEYNMELTKKYASKEYWNYRSYQELGIAVSTEAQYMFYKRMMNQWMY